MRITANIVFGSEFHKRLVSQRDQFSQFVPEHTPPSTGGTEASVDLKLVLGSRTEWVGQDPWAFSYITLITTILKSISTFLETKNILQVKLIRNSLQIMTDSHSCEILSYFESVLF